MQKLLNKKPADKYNILKNAKDKDWEVFIENIKGEEIENSKIVGLEQDVLICNRFDYDFADIIEFNYDFGNKQLYVLVKD